MNDGRWGDDPPPLYPGDALVDIHFGRGTSWVRDRFGRYYPDCDCHRPMGVIPITPVPEVIVAAFEEPPLAPHPRLPAVTDTTAEASAALGAVISPRSASEGVPDPVTGLRLLARLLRGIVGDDE